MKVLGFAASSSRKSINKELVKYALGLLDQVETEVIDLNDYELPLFSEDKEKEIGQAQLAKDFLEKISESDALVVSFAEHNGSYTAAYKNLFDWCSRINREVFQNKPLVFLASSPGKGGAKNVLELASNSAKYFAGDLKSSLSIPNFYDNFDLETGMLTNETMKAELMSTLKSLELMQTT